jgi:hypothetical protein
VKALDKNPSTEARPTKLEFATEYLGLTLDPWQARVLQSNSLRTLLNISRQGGKSTVSAILGLYESIYEADSLTVILSPSQRQSSELFRKITKFRERLPFSLDLVEDNRLSMTVRGGGRVVSLPSSESTVRGYSGVTLLIADEAARIPDELYLACRPMLSTKNGALMLMSTPFGKRGFFWQAWSGESVWVKEEIPASMIPRISAEFLAEEKQSMPLNWYVQEYCCQFTESVDSVFGHDDVMNALDDTLEPFFTTDDFHTVDDNLSPFEELA